jgi:uncharacterized membrane protein YhaH (DUF805 family)
MLKTFDIFRLSPSRINRVRHLGLFISWFLFAVISFSLCVQMKLWWLTGIGFILLACTLVNIILLKIRRLHDFDLCGWYLLICLIPLVGAIWAIIIFMMPGTKDTNRYGDPTYKLRLREILMIYFMPIIYCLVAVECVIFLKAAYTHFFPT